MPAPECNPLHELLKYATVAGLMCAVMLVLTHGKWLTALIIGVWIAFVILRFKRRS